MNDATHLSYTDAGVRDIAAGLAEAKVLVSRRRSDLQHQIGVMEAEVASLGKIAVAVAAALEVLRAEQAGRDAQAKAKP